jgi:DNA polymerase/3'-5' exonuclease PolX
MNNKIIEEFERLLAFIQEEIDKLIADKNIKALAANQFRLKQITNITNILKNYPIKIKLDNYLELKKISGIGKGTIDRVEEILINGQLSELGDFVDNKKEKKKIIKDLESVVGIGHTHAIDLYNKGIKSVKDLKQKIKDETIEVNEKIELGLKYYGKFQGNIPRSEIDKIYKIFNNILKKINNTLKIEKQFIFEFCGSYRRENVTSGDIDILISKFGKVKDDNNYLIEIVNLLKEPINKNNKKPLIVDDITELGKTKYMGFLKYLDNPVRRIDIRFVNYDSFYSALLYFTGSVELNKQMRQIAKTKNLKLSEYGLFKENGEKIPINNERDIFDILEMEYIIPRLR